MHRTKRFDRQVLYVVSDLQYVGICLSRRCRPFCFQVSCGLYHTACVTAAGVAMTWGNNESGQVGHVLGVLVVCNLLLLGQRQG